MSIRSEKNENYFYNLNKDYEKSRLKNSDFNQEYEDNQSNSQYEEGQNEDEEEQSENNQYNYYYNQEMKNNNIPVTNVNILREGSFAPYFNHNSNNINNASTPKIPLYENNNMVIENLKLENSQKNDSEPEFLEDQEKRRQEKNQMKNQYQINQLSEDEKLEDLEKKKQLVLEQIRIKCEEQKQLNKIAKRQNDINQNVYNVNENNSFGIKNNFGNNLISNNYQSQKGSINDNYNNINSTSYNNFNNSTSNFNYNTNNNSNNFNNNSNNFNNNSNNFNNQINNYNNNNFYNNTNNLNNNNNNLNNNTNNYDTTIKKQRNIYEDVKSYFKPVLYDDTKSDYTYHPKINENNNKKVKKK